MTFIKNIINDEGNVSIYKYKGDDLKKITLTSNDNIYANSERIRICFIDTETTGLNFKNDQIIEIGLKCIEMNKNTGRI